MRQRETKWRFCQSGKSHSTMGRARMNYGMVAMKSKAGGLPLPCGHLADKWTEVHHQSKIVSYAWPFPGRICATKARRCDICQVRHHYLLHVRVSTLLGILLRGSSLPIAALPALLSRLWRAGCLLVRQEWLTRAIGWRGGSVQKSAPLLEMRRLHIGTREESREMNTSAHFSK